LNSHPPKNLKETERLGEVANVALYPAKEAGQSHSARQRSQ